MNEGTNLENEVEMLKLEHLKFDLEKERLQLERDRLRSEQQMRKWTILSITIPLIALILTLAFSIWSQSEQSKREFTLRAAEIVLNSERPGEIPSRMRALLDLFPNQLPPELRSILADFDPDQYTSGSNYDTRMNFLRLVFEGTGQTQEVIEMYKKLFPNSDIIQEIER